MYAERTPPRLAAAAASIVAAALAPAQDGGHHREAIDRRFTFVDETLHGAPEGQFELENRVVWSRGPRLDRGLDRFDFRHELEYGLSDTLHLGIDLIEWHTSDATGDQVTKFDAVGAELKWKLADPRTDTVGLGFKTEVGFGPRELEWSNVLLVDTIVDRWELAYNLALEFGLDAPRSFEYEEGDFRPAQFFGASYEVDPDLCLGAELVHEFPRDWKWGERQDFFVGPNVAIRGDEWAITATALFLADGGADAPAHMFQLLFEFDF